MVEAPVYDIRECLDLALMLVKTQIREKRINSIEELHGMMRHFEAALDAAKLREGAEPAAWPNGCNESVPDALRFLAEHDRPIGGAEPYNAEHLCQLAAEIERMASKPLYLHPATEQTDARSGVRVLGEWRRGYCDERVTIEQASTGFGSVYQVRVLGGVVWLDFPDQLKEELPSVGAAKAAAQADYERRVRAALSPAAPEGRQEAVETVEISDLCSEIDRKLPDDFPNYGDWSVALPAGHWRDIRNMFAALSRPTERAVTEAERPLVDQLTGALRFILAFYEPGQRYLDTEAWKHAEAGGRRALAAGEAALAQEGK